MPFTGRRKKNTSGEKQSVKPFAPASELRIVVITGVYSPEPNAHNFVNECLVYWEELN